LDPQAALSVSAGIAVQRLPTTVYQVLTGESEAHEAIVPTRLGPDILPAQIELAAAELELTSQIGRERFLADALQHVASQYDFILIDHPPSLGILAINGLVAAPEVIIPVQCDFLAAKAIALLLDSIERIRSKLSPTLRVLGILPTMYNARTLHAQEVLDELRATFNVPVFPFVVKHSVRFKEAPAAAMSILDYAPDQDGAAAYRALAKELLK
jgi:chromosome partitioning protein